MRKIFALNAIPILEKNLDKINWISLSGNPNAIHILEKNLDKINWSTLATNPNAIPILEKNTDKKDKKRFWLDWDNLQKYNFILFIYSFLIIL